MGVRAGRLRERVGHLCDRGAMPGLRCPISLDRVPGLRADVSTPRMVSPLRLTVFALGFAATGGARLSQNSDSRRRYCVR